jgi:proline dehydrogenase
MISWLSLRSGLSKRFVAGESFDAALQAVQNLNRAGIPVSLDLLGEGIEKEADAREAAEIYRQLLCRIGATGINANISIKLTQIGLDISSDLCGENLDLVLGEAQSRNNLVRIDMEDSQHTEQTISLFRKKLSVFGPEHVGIVLQSYLYRTERDLQELAPLGCNIRLCKGAYMEPPEVAFPKKKDVDASFKRLMETMLSSTSFSAIATHDEAMIAHARQLIRTREISPDRYEFQMLYGVRRERQLQLKEQLYPVRVYVPYGRRWAPYFMRRLAERPANLLFILKNLFRR